MSSLGNDYPNQQARCRELLHAYHEIGPNGMFAALMIEEVLQRADKAAVSGDVVAMIRCFEEMKGCQ
jgi:hypothetical protein